MDKSDTTLSTGLPSFDRILQGIRAGDNIVFQVGSIQDYIPFIGPYAQDALKKGRKLIYFRFARHEELLPPDSGAEVHRLHPEVGFETFTSEIHRVIEKAGRGAFYIFDCLSDLAVDWYSDLMLGNFFKVTCPYLFEMDTVTYFALLRQRHSFHAVAAIRDTTQLLLDVHRHSDRLYVHPLKVWQRYSPSMYLPHVWEREEFRPVTESGTLAGLFATLARTGVDSASRTLDLWDRAFLEAQEARDGLSRKGRAAEVASPLFQRLLRMVLSRDERILDLAARHLGLADLLEIRKRMIGTGLLGGKSAGMLLARAILAQAAPRWKDILEEHDSIYIGSDVFYTYLVNNGLWRLRQRQRDPKAFLDNLDEVREKMLGGQFPDFIREQFVEMLDRFGQSPIVVRSSSLLEDNFGNAFAGKYESVFCVNQGTPQERLDAFTAAVRKVYASAMGPDALQYRAHRGLLDRDEQMALLVQRVSGTVYGSLHYPQIAGVGLSYNPYVWSDLIDPEAGLMRLVFGLGTRAVFRSDDDYTRIVALNAPLRRPEANYDEVRAWAQRRVDVLDLESRRLETMDFEKVARSSPDLPLQIFATRDPELESRARERGDWTAFSWVLTFHQLLASTNFPKDMKEMLDILKKAYNYPVDLEFTANFKEDQSYRINLVQCRPFQVKWGGAPVEAPADLKSEDKVLEAQGAIIGRSALVRLDRIIHVVPSVYAELNTSDRYSVARLIGRLTRMEEGPEPKKVLLLGPGRWGTLTPTLGVPVSFSEIDRVTALCEMVEMGESQVPDVSLGTHFFNDIVETQMFYMALYTAKKPNAVNAKFFREMPNRLGALLPGEAVWSHVVRVVEASDLPSGRSLQLNVNTMKQQAMCYIQ